jgi:hypothetical protein
MNRAAYDWYSRIGFVEIETDGKICTLVLAPLSPALWNGMRNPSSTLSAPGTAGFARRRNSPVGATGHSCVSFALETAARLVTPFVASSTMFQAAVCLPA